MFCTVLHAHAAEGPLQIIDLRKPGSFRQKFPLADQVCQRGLASLQKTNDVTYRTNVIVSQGNHPFCISRKAFLLLANRFEELN